MQAIILQAEKQITLVNMNENTFQSQRTHTRVKFEPLTTHCQLVCLTPMSPCVQSITVLSGTAAHEPDRSLTPTVIFPDVRASDPDEIFQGGPVNHLLSLDTIEWLVDEEPIEDVLTLGTDYTINTSESDLRGALTFKVNLAASEKMVLHFRAKFLDWRTGIAYAVESDDIALTCTDKGEDVFSCSVDKPSIEYDPLFDDLLLYDYKVARGITVQGSRSDYVTGKCYEQSVNVILAHGTEQLTTLPSGITMRVVKVGQSTALVANSVANPELLAATFPTVKFDMRLVSKGEYEVQFMQNGNIIARATIGLHTSTTMPSFGKPLRASDISPSQDMYFNSVLLNLQDRIVEYPECYYLIEWFTQAKYNNNGTWQYAASKTWQRGENLAALVADLGIGVTVNDSFFDLWFELDAHGSCSLLTDETDDVLTDENDVLLIG